MTDLSKKEEETYRPSSQRVEVRNKEAVAQLDKKRKMTKKRRREKKMKRLLVNNRSRKTE